jgi:hypothetical protein
MRHESSYLCAHGSPCIRQGDEIRAPLPANIDLTRYRIEAILAAWARSWSRTSFEPGTSVSTTPAQRTCLRPSTCSQSKALPSAIHARAPSNDAAFALRELRVQSNGRPLRVFYAFDPARQAVLLIGGDKTGDNRFYENMNPQAERIWKEYLDENAQVERR